MNNVMQGIIKFVDKNTYPVLLTLFILWMCVGIFPLQCYETDGQEIILGCDIMYREGWSLPPVYSYAYRMQPLTTILVVALKHLMPFFTCEQIYCFLTALAALLFLFGSISFVRHITKASKSLILLAAMLLPEIYAIAMYPNTAIPAAACFIWAMVLIVRQRLWLASVLLIVSVLFRLDILAVFPAVLPLLLFEGKPLKHALGLSLGYGVFVMALVVGLSLMLKTDWFGTYEEYQHNGPLITPAERILSITGFYSLAYFLLLPIGIGVIIAKKRWMELFVVLLPIVLIHYIYGAFGNASKHYLYNAPFVIIAGVRAMEWLQGLLRKHAVLKWATVVALILFMTVSVRKWNLSVPWISNNPLNKVGVVVPLYETERAGTGYGLGIGAGFQLCTNDEDMLLTGHAFYPWYIREIKRVMGDWRSQQKAAIDKVPTSNILVLEFGAAAPLSFEYMTEPYHFQQLKKMPEAYRYTISNAERDLHFWRVVLTAPLTDSQQVVDYINSVSKDFLDGECYLLSANNHYGACYFMDELVPQGILEKKADRLYKILK
ncbi:MAG: hypothetical protein E7103_01645 [Prevotella sp.]|nr:hypothetical protein [Prevotella sp.]